MWRTGFWFSGGWLLGYDPGEGDGLLGAGTRAALREWQLARDLEPTGYLTAATAEVLRTVGEQVVAEAERRRPGRMFRDCGTCPEMVVVPPGSYMMGSPASEAVRGVDEGPRHRVTIGYTLAAGVHEVTFGEWDACVGAGGCGGVPTRGRGLGPGEPTGDQRELGGCAGLRAVVVA